MIVYAIDQTEDTIDANQKWVVGSWYLFILSYLILYEEF